MTRELEQYKKTITNIDKHIGGLHEDLGGFIYVFERKVEVLSISRCIRRWRDRMGKNPETREADA
jgi:hypothetical protein